jgi:hypothetical protein
VVTEIGDLLGVPVVQGALQKRWRALTWLVGSSKTKIVPGPKYFFGIFFGGGF